MPRKRCPNRNLRASSASIQRVAERQLLTFDMDGVLCRPPLGINPGTGTGKRRVTI